MLLVLTSVCDMVVPEEAEALLIFGLEDGTQEKDTPVLMLEDKAILVGEPEQIDCVTGVAVTVGLGFTTIMKVIGVPLHTGVAAAGLVYLGVTVIVAKIGVVPALVAVKTGSGPVPLAANPIAGLLLLHSKMVPVTSPAKVMEVEEPL